MRKYGCHHCHTDVSVRWCDSRPGDDVLMTLSVTFVTPRDTLVTRRQAEATGDKVSWYVASVGSGSVLTGISRRVIRSSHQSPVTLNICSIMLGPALKVKFVSSYELSFLN